MVLPPDYLEWQKAARRLLEPLMNLVEPNGTEVPLTPIASDHDANADRLEAFARPLLLAACWLQSVADGTDDAFRERVADWFRGALVRGSDPRHPGYWGPNTNYHQNGVEIGLLACALLMARKQLWDPLSPEEQRQVGHWIASNRATGHVWNNHFYFGILALEFLREVGQDRPADRISVDAWFREMEGMYRGGGWFMDGMNQSFDHYNAYAFHFYGLLWSHLFGRSNEKRRRQWCAWASTFLEEYQHAFAASGEHPAFGRSITYRFNACAPFSLACLLDASPLAPGRARRLCNRNLRFFLNKPIYQEQNAIGIGWWDVFPELRERYTCSGSVYWAAKAFVCLLLPPDHLYWTAEEEPLASEEGDYVRPQPEAGLVFRAVDGAVEILNAGTEIAPVNMPKFGAWKWGKLAYRTGFGFQIGEQGEHYNKVMGTYSRDGGLTLTSASDERVLGRHYTQLVEMDDEHFACTYALGDKVEQSVTVVESYVWWRAGWLLQLHWIDAYQEVQLHLGGYSLAERDPGLLSREENEGRLVAKSVDRFSLLQPISGFSRLTWDERLDEASARSHIQAPYHITPVAETQFLSGEHYLAALVYAGSQQQACAPWAPLELNNGCWSFRHPHFGEWTIRHGALPAIQ